MSYAMKRRVLKTVIVILFIIAMCSVLKGFKVSADTNLRVNERKFFTGYVVQSGDSLWTIADEYMTKEYKNHEAYIEEVMHSNQMKSDRLYPGQLLVLPYYVDAPMDME